MTPTRRSFSLTGVLAALVLTSAACESTPAVPAHPTWADVAPILRGQCGGCHGWTAQETGKSYRLDLYDLTPEVCGDAAMALDRSVILAGSALSAGQIEADLGAQSGARWPRMPPQPAPGLADWERETIERWTEQPTKGPPTPGNRAPTIAVSQFPSVADRKLEFTAIIDDPDGDSVVGVVEIAGSAFLMNRPGAFTVRFDSTTWPPGAVRVGAVLCDGWSKVSTDLGPVQIQH